MVCMNHFYSQGVVKIYPPLWFIHPQITILCNVPSKAGHFYRKSLFPRVARFFQWDSVATVPNSYIVLWCPNQFSVFSAHFVRNVCGHFGFKWPVSKINSFELARAWELGDQMQSTDWVQRLQFHTFSIQSIILGKTLPWPATGIPRS